MARFSKCPTWWTRNGTLIEFHGGRTAGSSIAALKCAMAISTIIEFHSRRGQISYSGLEQLTGLSRPMVQRGIERLEELEIINADRSGHANNYQLTTLPDDDYWAKLPAGRVQQHLPSILNRGAIPLAALKIYMLLVSIRPNDSSSVSISYDKLREQTGIQRAHIRSALDILYSHSLVRITRNEEVEGKHNVYTILGIEAVR